MERWPLLLQYFRFCPICKTQTGRYGQSPTITLADAMVEYYSTTKSLRCSNSFVQGDKKLLDELNSIWDLTGSTILNSEDYYDNQENK